MRKRGVGLGTSIIAAHVLPPALLPSAHKKTDTEEPSLSLSFLSSSLSLSPTPPSCLLSTGGDTAPAVSIGRQLQTLLF